MEANTHSYLSPSAASSGFRRSRLTWFRWDQLAITIMRSPSTARSSRLSCNRQVGNMADTSQCFATETVCPDRSEVLEFFEFGRCESFAEDG